MKGYARAAVVAVLSVGIAAVLSVLPDLQRTGEQGEDQTVFHPDRPVRLTEDNLVDALVAVPLELDIAKADVQQSVLSVDLFLKGRLSGSQTVYHDLYELSQFAWSSTNNVEKVLVRVLSDPGESRSNRELLLAMEAKRSQTREGITSESSTINLRDYLQARYQLTYTQKWKES